MADVGKTPDRVAEATLKRLGIEFIDDAALITEVKLQTIQGQTPDQIADALVDRIYPPRLSRDEVRGALESIAWLTKDILTGGQI